MSRLQYALCMSEAIPSRRWMEEMLPVKTNKRQNNINGFACKASWIWPPSPPISRLTGNIFTAHHGVQNQASTLNMGGTGEGASKEAVSKARHFNFMYWQHFFHPQYKWFALTRLHQAPPHCAHMADLSNGLPLAAPYTKMYRTC